MSENKDEGASHDTGDEVPELPNQALSTYARLWQLETWLRRMVYVELRALRGDGWNTGIDADRHLNADKRLRHMPTPENDPLSYISFSQLTHLVRDHWDAFACYLPPQDIWLAKLEEIGQIRNRIAHFRSGHTDDYPRVLQFLRDLDRGFWSFCTSYNDPEPILPAADDPVTSHFLPYDPFPWTEIRSKKWARIGHASSDMILSVTVEVLRRPWRAKQRVVDGAAGYLYDVQIIAREGREFDYERFLEGTSKVHSHLAHICLCTSAGVARLTIPSLLGSEKIIAIVTHALDVARYVVDRRGSPRPGSLSAKELAKQWPEFVLGPDNPLTFLSPEMPCTFFAA